MNELGRYQEALECAEKVISLDPNFPHGYGTKGEALRALGKKEESLEWFDKSISLDPHPMNPARKNKKKALDELGRNEDEEEDEEEEEEEEDKEGEGEKKEEEK